MKTNKIILNSCFILALSLTKTITAQLKVQSSNGHVGVGTLNPISKLQVVGDAAVFSSTGGWPTSAAFIRCNNNFSGSTNPEYTWFNADQTGLFHPSANVIGFTAGGTQYANISNGVYKLKVFGSAVTSGGTWVNSDKRFKKNINIIDGALNKVLKLSGVNYEYNKDEYKPYNFDDGKTLGFIAQDLEQVVPEVVKKDEKGYYSINYTALIPLLVEAFKEQNKKIEDLQQQVQTLNSSNGNSSNGAINSQNGNSINPLGNIGQGSNAILYQNAPNPFNNETKIKFFIPSTVKTANLYIYDKEGNKKKSILIEARNESDIKIAANELGQGIYFYSLILDGVIFDSKTMLITQ
ncbi:MAG: tail fiber domain-containing protein [Bacteroidota bacterium]|nr:tail fiber domain-containing protein [Bacteroidota bacterium]